MNTIQIIGYRDIINPDTGKKFRKQIHFDKVKVRDIIQFFNGQIHDVVNAIPAADRYDCHYTTAYCLEHTPETPLRAFHSQNIIPFDFDDIDLESYKHTSINQVVSLRYEANLITTLECMDVSGEHKTVTIGREIAIKNGPYLP